MGEKSNTILLSRAVGHAAKQCARLFRSAGEHLARHIFSAWSVVRADTVRDWRQAQTHLRSARSLVRGVLAPEQLVPILKIVWRTIRVLAFMFFVAMGLLIYSGPMLFWGSFYEGTQMESDIRAAPNNLCRRECHHRRDLALCAPL